jgi:hypothetical protein
MRDAFGGISLMRSARTAAIDRSENRASSSSASCAELSDVIRPDWNTPTLTEGEAAPRRNALRRLVACVSKR